MSDRPVSELLGTLRSEVAALYGDRLDRLVLFGSRARADAVQGSDLDLLLVLRGPVRPGEEIRRTSELAARLSLAHDIDLQLIPMAADRYEAEQSPFLLNVRREGVAV